MATLDNLMMMTSNRTKREVATDKEIIFNNGILSNAFDTYLSILFSKKLILNSKEKTTIDKSLVIEFLENKGLNIKLFKRVIFDLWYGGGGGLVIYNDNNQLEYVSNYQPISTLDCNYQDYRRNPKIKYKGDKIFYEKNLISGSYFHVKKDFDDFGNSYSVVDKCYLQLKAYNELSRFVLEKAGKNFEREMFYQVSSDYFEDFLATDSEEIKIEKKQRNNQLFELLKEKLKSALDSLKNKARIIQNAINPVFVDTEIDLDKLVTLKNSIIKEIALCCNISASNLGISNSANKSQSEQDSDNLSKQATIYTNIFVDLSNYWLRQFYPDLKDFYFTWEENETDESLQVREQNLEVFKFYTKNASLLKGLGVDVDTNKIVELANSVSIPDLFVVKEKVEEVEQVDVELSQLRVDSDELDEVFAKYSDTVNLSYSELLVWSKTDTSKLASLDRSPINRNLELLNTNKENWTDKHIAWANKTISFVSRMKNGEQGEEVKNTGWSKRDISLMNWAYNPKKDKGLFTRAVDLTNLKYLKIEDWESQKDYKDTTTKINNSIKKYIREAIKSKDRAVPKLEDFLTKADFENYLKQLTNLIYEQYNLLYDTEYNNLPAIDDYIGEVTNLTFNGDGKDYEGLQSSIEKQIKNGQSYEQVAKSSLQSINGNLYVRLFNQSYENLRVQDGANFIGTVAKNDSLVRRDHLANQNIIHKTTELLYWLEPNCRCNRIYGTVQELLEAGFSNPKNY